MELFGHAIHEDWFAVLPMLILVGVSILLLLADIYGSKLPVLFITLSSAVVALFCSLPYFDFYSVALNGAIYVDRFSFVFYAILILGLIAALLLNHKQLEGQRITPAVEIEVLLMLGVVGGMAMVSAANLIVLFLAVETLSLSSYVLAGFARFEKASSEAALKYLILGAFSSACLLYGIALIYGAVQTVSLPEIASVLSTTELAGRGTLLKVGLGLLIFGFGFKVSLVPFHFWTPDVYQGSPVSVVTYMGVVVKAAAFGAFLRLFYVSFGSVPEMWTGALWLISALSMTLGNIAALRQRSVKRMLAYSSVAHAGYTLVGLVATGYQGSGEAVIFYMLTYCLMTILSFGVVLAVSSNQANQYAEDSIENFSGLGYRNPCLGILMTVAILSLAGIPPLSGFVAKLYLFNAALTAGFTGLAIIFALNSVISLAYYLRIIVAMYFNSTTSESHSTVSNVTFLPKLNVPFTTYSVLFFSATSIVLIGLYPEPFWFLATTAIESLTPWG